MRQAARKFMGLNTGNLPVHRLPSSCSEGSRKQGYEATPEFSSSRIQGVESHLSQPIAELMLETSG